MPSGAAYENRAETSVGTGQAPLLRLVAGGALYILYAPVSYLQRVAVTRSVTLPVLLLLLVSAGNATSATGDEIGDPKREGGSMTTTFELPRATPEEVGMSGERLAEQSRDKSKSFVHRFTLLPGHSGSPKCLNCVNHVSGIICEPCVEKLKAGYGAQGGIRTHTP